MSRPIGVNVDSASFRPDASLFSTSQFELKNLLMSEQWHSPYAAALRETDPAKLQALITESEDAIFSRYLELCVSAGSKEQVLDVHRAVNTLSQLKKLKEDANR